MNIDQAKTIAISEILNQLGYSPTKENEKDAWYISPWRDEKTASFHLNKHKNIWFDHGEGAGGNVLDFVMTLLKHQSEDHTLHDALRWIGNMSVPNFSYRPNNSKIDETASWILKRSEPLQDLALIRYIKNRGISVPLAKKHLVEVYVRHPVKKLGVRAIGFKNEDGGYEMRNPFFKSCIAPKTISFIRGSVTKPDKIHVFEGWPDYLTFLTIRKGKQEEDVIVLNSTSCVQEALAYMKGYGYKLVCSWMDNNKAGIKATAQLEEFAKSEPGLSHKSMNNVYTPFEDVNAWHMHNFNLSL